MDIPDDYAQVGMHFTTGTPSRPALVLFGVFLDVGTPSTAMCAAINTLWGDTIADVQCSDTILTNVTLQVGPSPDGPTYEYPSNTPGGLAEASLPNASAVLVTKGTDLGGRRMRGRSYWPGPTEPQTVDGSTLSSTALADWVAACAAFHDGLDAIIGIPMHLLHGPPTEWQLVGGQPRRVPIAGTIPPPTPVVSYTAQGVLASQRRRQRK